MRILSFLTSLIVILSFVLPWLKPPSGEMTFIAIFDQVLTTPHGFEGVFWWLNPTSTGSILTFVAFFAGLFLVLLGVFFGILGGRLGPGIGLVGMFLFTTVAWYMYGGGFVDIIGEGYLLGLGGFVAGFVLGGGKYL
ncbi:amino acid permease [Thermococcus aciditolerans]|uniref:Amino acid permease n=1 Tax=Thermococcus aciditolerans TaxID=2598455 RepID=A0A5C0SMM7_9EURY|nr:amino acid permease [Thermococcus aciditolerans]QEK14694.1 amino acid permease [Thermococcus aciditolerans]